ncbi:MAG TPA: TonB family protein, partial [Thermoanaerobaculia bacterium]|nr:TonB family protein [Thermoanaerobaculia bacterium]
MNTREEFGKYLLLKKLAEDPLGETFRAGSVGQRGLEQVVLLQVFNGTGLDAERLWSVLASRKEVQAALKSPNIGNGVDAGRVRGVSYVAYDYISGKDLGTLSAQAQRESSPFPTDHALMIGDRIGLALTAAYETRFGGERVIHGMVTPRMVMISNEGETRLLGFEAGPGLAAQAAALPPEIQLYVAPEVRAGAAADKGSDVFSLGAILFELLTGKALPVAPAGDYHAVLAQARLATEGKPLPQPVATLIARSLAPPEERIPDAPSWHKALSRLLAEGGYNATTFNLAFFMHNLFREEIERESKEIEAEKTLEIPGRRTAVAATGAETMKLPQADVRKAVAAPPPGAPTPADDTAAVKARYALKGEEGEVPSKKWLWIGLAAAVVAAALGVGGWLMLSGRGADEPTDAEAEGAAELPVPAPEAAEPEEPAGPTPEELQAQIDATFDERAKAMEASFKAEADKRIAVLQRQLDAAEEEAADRSQRLEEARKEAEAARQAVAEKEAEAKTAAAAPATKGDQVAAKTPPAPAGPAVAPVAGAEAVPAPAVEPEPAAPRPQTAPAEPEIKRGQLVTAGPGVIQPRPTRREPPAFPPAAARLNREATVTVRVLVDETGKVIEAEIEGRRAGMGFDEEALKAARGSTFEPA